MYVRCLLIDYIGLSNKKWDKTIKGLTGKDLAAVNKTEEGLFVELV
ncbi:hypothetical protein FHR24_000240 [Wenyingzhuangia heitensis]|uniref:Uncharacterized protein n=1 Tax=Wenyingzhuangia heitensis TaxID=1487859 RepID=A0ABX0U9I4_9FLAO|nr:hypothetical protein [Wenyingzhuangia heitensis]NIJ43801.1 hypothetical protein [Wenyingzhuangia heitensis]